MKNLLLLFIVSIFTISCASHTQKWDRTRRIVELNEERRKDNSFIRDRNDTVLFYTPLYMGSF